MRDDIRPFLTKVKTPGRYVGGEPGSVMKDKSRIKMRWAFCFPDLYEIGMSNLGVKILSGVLNEMDDVWCERVFAPYVDMEEEMRKRGIPLFALESGDGISEFDMVAFSVAYELAYSNLVNMLDLGGIPLLSGDRSETDPIVIAGGHCTYNPEPLADFVDIFSIGEGEEALPELSRLYISMKDDGTYSRKAFLYRAATELEGFYVPSLYSVEYNEDGTVKRYQPVDERVPPRVKKRIVSDLDRAYFPTCPVLPLVEATQDRITLEVFRGCIRGCRFCQAGFIMRPVREKSTEVLCDIAREYARNTGYDEISLSSLSISDYSKVDELTDKLLDWTKEEKISLSLPSLRADSFTKELLDRISAVRTSTLTFAPEAGTQRLRDVINKNVTEEDILNACRLAFESGKSQVKLYFMDGLPCETYDDIAGIRDLAVHVVDEYYRTPGRNKAKQPKVTLSVACFIPKPHTPFQWEGQNTEDVLKEKQQFLLDRIKSEKKIKYNYHDADISHIEAVFARGDRRLGKALLKAHEKGMKFCAWDEFFNYEKWIETIEECGLSPYFYANRTIPDTEVLPWDIIDCGVSKEFLIRERHKAYEAATTSSCKDQCSGCGADKVVDGEFCAWCPKGRKNARKTDEKVPLKTAFERETPKDVKPAAPQPEKSTVSKAPVRTVRVRFSKTGPMLYLSHLDLARNMMRGLVKSGLPLWYTEGFNPIPWLAFAWSLSVGCGGDAEACDFKITSPVSDVMILKKLREAMPDGVVINEVYSSDKKFKHIKWAKYDIIVKNGAFELDSTFKIEELFSKPVVLMKKTKSGEKETDITKMIKSLSARFDGDGLVIGCVTACSDGEYLNPEYIMTAVNCALDIEGETGYHIIMRRKFLLEDGVTEFR